MDLRKRFGLFADAHLALPDRNEHEAAQFRRARLFAAALATPHVPGVPAVAIPRRLAHTLIGSPS